MKEESPQKLILAFVGMPGAGKSEATQYLQQKGIPFVRFGDATDEGLKILGLPLAEQNEKIVREQLRRDLGMAVYAIKAKPKIDELLKTHRVIVLDGLYSWEEYIYLKQYYLQLALVHIYSEREKRYRRLANRSIRPLNKEEAGKRDVAEIEKLNKGGPIAIADYLIDNTADNNLELHRKIDFLLKRLGVNLDDQH